MGVEAFCAPSTLAQDRGERVVCMEMVRSRNMDAWLSSGGRWGGALGIGIRRFGWFVVGDRWRFGRLVGAGVDMRGEEAIVCLAFGLGVGVSLGLVFDMKY
jgi:hypothetical protein